jgi:hypothetical protein
MSTHGGYPNTSAGVNYKENMAVKNKNNDPSENNKKNRDVKNKGKVITPEKQKKKNKAKHGD